MGDPVRESPCRAYIGAGQRRSARIPHLARHLTVSVLALALAAAAPLPAPAPLPAADAALVAWATAYLQSLSTDTGHFTQTDAKGAVAEGTFWLQRPGRARFEYAPPSGLVITSNGQVVSVVDHRLGTIRSYPLGLTPLSLFLARDIRLDRGVAVTAVDREAGGFAITAVDARRKNEGRIRLDFSASPISLRGWTITDAQGRSVRVELADFGPSAPRAKAFFELADPAKSASQPGPEG